MSRSSIFPAEIARGDASIAWNLGNLASHHWMLAMFDPATQDELWQDPDVLIALVLHLSRRQGDQG